MIPQEVITDVDRVQPIGLETYPSVDGNGEVIILFPNGNRDNGIAINIGNRSKRPKDLSAGDTTLYDENDNRVDLSGTGIDLKDMHGHEINMQVLGIILKSGDATMWMPSVIPNCPFGGAPHGGPTAGIIKLKGA